LSPLDFALGWGRVTDETALKDVSIVQKGRLCLWRVVAVPIPHNKRETSSANIHMAPANCEIESIKRDQTISVKGYANQRRG